MKTEFRGEPVAGGTFPAGIWKTFMEAVLRIDPQPKEKDDEDEAAVPGATAPTAPAPAAPAAPAPETNGGTQEQAPAQPEQPAPEDRSDTPPAEQPPTGTEVGGGETTPPSGGTAPPAAGEG